MTRYSYFAGTDVEGHNSPTLCGLHISNKAFLIDQCPEHWWFEQSLEVAGGEDYVCSIEDRLQRAVERRVRARKGELGILFSGGLDCSLVVYFIMNYFQSSGVIHLYSVAFSKTFDGFEKCPDRITAESSLQVLQQLFPKVKLELHRINVFRDEMEKNRPRIKFLINPLKSVLDDSIGSGRVLPNVFWTLFRHGSQSGNPKLFIIPPI